MSFLPLLCFRSSPLASNNYEPRKFSFELYGSLFLNFLSMILLCQTAAQLLSASMIIYALNNTIKQSSTSSVILQPWFMVLVVAGAIERLAGLALGVTMERDWVVMVIWMICTC